MPWGTAVLCACVAMLAFQRTLAGGFLSDDLLLGVLGSHRADGFAVDWGEVFADFGRPWLGFEAPFYRPLLTVSFAIDQAIGGGAPLPFHVTNLLLHGVVTAATALIAGLLCPTRARLAALVAGACVALHPIAVEPVAWIAARNSELEVAFRTLAMLAFTAYLARGARRARLAAVVLGACAFATKESAVMLPVSLLAIDVLHAPRRPFAERLRLHLPFAGLVVAYFLLRVAVFGEFTGDTGGAAGGTPTGRVLGKLDALLAAGTIATVPLLAWLLVAGLLRRRTTLVVGALWLVAHTLPTWQLEMTGAFGGSRMMYGALVALGVVTARIVTGARWARAGGIVAFGTWLALFLLVTQPRIAAYRAAWQDMARVDVHLAALAGHASPMRPLALGAMPIAPPGIPPLNPNAWFALAQRPHLDVDLPVVSLGYMTVPVPLAESLHHDASAVHALEERGCAIATWDGAAGRFLVHPPPAPADLPALLGAGAVRRFAEPVRATAVEALDVHVTGGRPRALRLTLQCSVPQPIVIEAGPGVPDGDGVRFAIDLSHHMMPAALATYGIPLEGFAIAFDGPGTLGRVEAHPRVPELPVDAPVADPLHGWAALATLRAPSAPEGSTLRLVLLGPHSAIPVQCEPDQPVQVPAPVRREFEGFARIAAHDRLLFWFEVLTPTGRPGFARSRVRGLDFDVPGP